MRQQKILKMDYFVVIKKEVIEDGKSDETYILPDREISDGEDIAIKSEDSPKPSASKDIPQEKACKCKASWVWKKQTYNGCDPKHPEAERNWW